MNTVSLPSFTQFKYPLLNYGELGNLLRDTEFNRRALQQRVAMVNYNLPNQHVLVGLLQQLAIDPDWSIEYVATYARFRAYTLSTLFKITNIQNLGTPQSDVFYYNGVKEVLFLLDNNRSYDELTTIEALCPVIPMYTTVNFHSYKPSIERTNSTTLPNAKGGIAFIGIDLVELAVGWWLYMRQAREVDTGIHAYLVKYPLVNAQLIHNQLNVVNTLYEHIVNETPYGDLMDPEEVTFITSDVRKKLTNYMGWLVRALKGRRLDNLGHLLAQIKSIYEVPYFDFLYEPGNSKMFAQTRWVYEPGVLKLFILYLTIANELSYKAGDINTQIHDAIPKMINNYQRIADKTIREHLIGLAKKAQQLNKLNMS
ncbi:hypothetical protein NFI00_000118 [Salmonella enterica]|nr:hypothetical protein [Salmonella enterica]